MFCLFPLYSSPKISMWKLKFLLIFTESEIKCIVSGLLIINKLILFPNKSCIYVNQKWIWKIPDKWVNSNSSSVNGLEIYVNFLKNKIDIIYVNIGSFPSVWNIFLFRNESNIFSAVHCCKINQKNIRFISDRGPRFKSRLGWIVYFYISSLSGYIWCPDLPLELTIR